MNPFHEKLVIERANPIQHPIFWLRQKHLLEGKAWAGKVLGLIDKVWRFFARRWSPWTEKWPQRKGEYVWFESDLDYWGVGVASICKRTDYRKPEHWEKSAASKTTTVYKADDGRDMIACWDSRYAQGLEGVPQPEAWSKKPFKSPPYFFGMKEKS